MSIYSLLLDTFGGSTFGRISMIILIDFFILSWFQLLFNILVGRERMRQNICNICHLISMFYYPSWLFMISWTFPGGSKRLLQNIYNIFIWFFMFFFLRISWLKCLRQYIDDFLILICKKWWPEPARPTNAKLSIRGPFSLRSKTSSQARSER